MDTLENQASQKQETTENRFKEKLFAKIKSEKLFPKPRWQFLLKNYVMWISGALALIVGALAVSVMIYLLKYNDWDIYSQIKKSFWESFLLTLPYFWIIFLGIFIFIVYYNFKHTENGYRYPHILLIGASIFFSILLGSVFFAAGIGEKIDNILGRRAPFYDSVLNPRIDFWSQPDKGRLAGMIVLQSSPTEFLLINRNREEWIIEVKNAKSHFNEKIVLGQPVNLVGKKISDNVFKVDEILPVRAGSEFFRRFDGSVHGPRDSRTPGINNIPRETTPMPF